MCDIINLNKNYNELELEQGDSRRIELQDQYYRGKKSIFIAYVLWFFLGALGIHKLYLRRWQETILHLSLLFGPIFVPEYTFQLWVFCALYLILDLFSMPFYAKDTAKRHADKIINYYKELV